MTKALEMALTPRALETSAPEKALETMPSQIA